MKLRVYFAAVAVYALAFVQPVEMVHSDPAMALVAAQALVEHGTLDLDVYRDDPSFAYEFDIYNHRVEERFGGHYYFNLGLPVAMAPVVGTANLLGWDMLDQDDEFALQNLVSAVLTALVFVLVYRLAGLYLGPGPSLVIALVSTLGSPLVSTLATGLWSADLQIVLLAGVLLFLKRRGSESLTPSAFVVLAAVLAAAFLIRPTTAFLGVALFLDLRGARDRRVAIGARVVLGLGTLFFVLLVFRLIPWIGYYSPYKILPTEVPVKALYGVLLSPSRGLFVYCAFLLPVVVVAGRRRRELWGDRFLRMVVAWIVLHVVAVSWKTAWWGGHCFGPRLLTEIVPGFVILTAWAWSTLTTASPRQRTVFAGAFLVLGAAAVFIHSYQGLFNPATARWSSEPNVDNPKYHGLLLSWRYPQFLATDAAIDERAIELRRRDLEAELPDVVSDGFTVTFHDDAFFALGFSSAEPDWRWSDGVRAVVLYPTPPAGTAASYELELVAGAYGEQRVGIALDGDSLGEVALRGLEFRSTRLAVPALVLRDGRIHEIEFRLPGAERPGGGDARLLALRFRSLRIVPIHEHANE